MLIRYRNPQFCHYRGRFAPSPTGPLHYGSLVTALASYLQARVNVGEWIIRIEDIDPEREVKGACQSILETLKDYGFEWDRKPIFQSQQHNLHKHIALQLFERKLAYSCSCSRKDLAANLNLGPMGPIYSGTCATKSKYSSKNSLRVRTKNVRTSFIDHHFGPQHCELEKESGDYVIFRADGLPSYILAASIDDLFESYSEIVRGADLLNITHRQLHLNQLIRNHTINFFHIPIITDESGNKLSKQTHAPALHKHNARANLYFALQDLGQEPPRYLSWQPIWSIWEWAFKHWNTERIPTKKTIKYNH